MEHVAVMATSASSEIDLFGLHDVAPCTLSSAT